MHPLKPRMTTYTACLVLLFIWLVSLAVVIPTALYSKTHGYFNDQVSSVQCGESWPNSRAMKAYVLILVTGEFLIPLTIMSVAYCLIARKLWFRRVPGGHVTEQQAMAAESSKRRTIRLLIIVVALFALCWAPYHLFAILRDIVLPSYQESHHTTFLTVFYLVEALAMSNSMFNTLIYVVFNANVRKYVLQIPDAWRRLKPRDKATVRYWGPLATRTSSHTLRSSVRSSQMRSNPTSNSTRLTINLHGPGSLPPSSPSSGGRESKWGCHLGTIGQETHQCSETLVNWIQDTWSAATRLSWYRSRVHSLKDAHCHRTSLSRDSVAMTLPQVIDVNGQCLRGDDWLKYHQQAGDLKQNAAAAGMIMFHHL